MALYTINGKLADIIINTEEVSDFEVNEKDTKRPVLMFMSSGNRYAISNTDYEAIKALINNG